VCVDEWAAAVGALAEAGDPLTARQLARNDWYRLKRAFTILRVRLLSATPSASLLCTSMHVVVNDMWTLLSFLFCITLHQVLQTHGLCFKSRWSDEESAPSAS